MLIGAGAKLDLYSACVLGEKSVVERVLRDSPDLLRAETHPLHRPPLHFAAQGASADIAGLLLRHGVDVNARNLRNETPLKVAVSSRYHTFIVSETPSLIDLLADHGGVR